jgi:hypothetical protein
MTESKPRTAGIGVAVLLVMLFSIIAFSSFPKGEELLFGTLANTTDKLTFAQLIVSFFGFIGAISAFTFAIYQYKKSEKWKRMEFVAKEVKEFEADPQIQNALLMIDWGVRKINLFLVSNPKDSDLRTVTRDVQWRSLLPHPIKQTFPEYQAEPKINPVHLGFTEDEAKIRDTYDFFLTRLDRLSTFIKARLIDSKELKPFIDYWIDAITTTEGLKKDAAWKCALLTYISYYKYTGVNELFETYGKSLSPDGKVYQKILSFVEDETLRKRLYASVQKPRTNDLKRSTVP